MTAANETIRVMSDGATYGAGVVDITAEPLATDGAEGAVDATKFAAATAPPVPSAVPPPQDARDAARAGALLAQARSLVVGWQARCEGRAAPAPDPLDPTAGVVRAGWMLADIAAASGLDPRASSPFAIGAALQERITMLVQAARAAAVLDKVLDEATQALSFYEQSAWNELRARGIDTSALDDGRKATAAIGSLRVLVPSWRW